MLERKKLVVIEDICGTGRTRRAHLPFSTFSEIEPQMRKNGGSFKMESSGTQYKGVESVLYEGQKGEKAIITLSEYNAMRRPKRIKENGEGTYVPIYKY